VRIMNATHTVRMFEHVVESFLMLTVMRYARNLCSPQKSVSCMVKLYFHKKLKRKYIHYEFLFEIVSSSCNARKLCSRAD